MSANALLDAALAYARLRWRVFPCRPGDKRPAIADWPGRATTDAATIRAWWNETPSANVAIATGRASGLLVLDVDARHDGDETLADLASEHAALPATVEATTGGGGKHYYFQYPGDLDIRNSTSLLGAGLDIRAESGYVIAPPSRTAGLYSFDTFSEPGIVELAPAPGWLIGLLTTSRNGHAPAGGGGIGERIPTGLRNETLASLGGTMRRRGMSEQAIAAALAAENAARCDPALPDAEVLAIAKSVARYEPVAAPSATAGATGGGGDDDGKRKESQATRLVGIATAAADLFHDDYDDAYARLRFGEHTETWSTHSKRFKQWLAGAFYSEHGTAVGAQALTDALNVIDAKARFDGPRCPVFVRLAPDGLGGFYLDLADDAWRAVHVTPAGWQIVKRPPVDFRRSPGMLALPDPVPGGSLDDLRELVNVPDDDGWAQIKAWLRGALRDRGPFPALALKGEQGSAKSTLAKMLRRLIDPAKPDLRSNPRELRDLAIAARNNWIVGFDNVSRVEPWLSDALCRLSTGAGWATRELYTDTDEVLFEATRPVVLNGITEFIVAGDLADRAIQIVLPEILDEKRREEKQLWTRFDAAAPRLLGALLDDAAGALRTLPSVRLARLPRMADFAVWAVAAERGAGEPARFLAAYTRARAESNAAAIEGSQIGQAIQKFIVPELAGGDWRGTASDLLTRLNALVDTQTRKERGWPRTGRGLAGELRRLAPAFRAVGVGIGLGERSGHGGPRMITIMPLEKTGGQSSPSSPSPDCQENSQDSGDDCAETNRHQPSPSSPEPSPSSAEFDAGDDVVTMVTIGDDSTEANRHPVLPVKSRRNRNGDDGDGVPPTFSKGIQFKTPVCVADDGGAEAPAIEVFDL